MWNRLAELEPPPMFTHFNRAVIEDIWKQCAVVHVESRYYDPDYFTLKFDYVGNLVAELLPDMQENIPFHSHIMNRQLKKLLKGFDHVIDHQESVVNSGTMIGRSSKIIKYRACLLPFTNTSREVVYIIVGFSWMEC